MGQKVNPHGLRVGVIKDWDSRWYARDDKVGDLIVEDYNIRKYLKKLLYAAGVPKIEIERDSAKVKVFIHCSRPGIVIGKGGAEIEKLRLDLEKKFSKPVDLSIIEVKNPDTDAQLVAENIASQLEKRVAFRRTMKNAMSRAMRFGVRGIKIKISGRIGGAEIARSEAYHEGTIPLQTLRADIDYGFAEAATTTAASESRSGSIRERSSTRLSAPPPAQWTPRSLPVSAASAATATAGVPARAGSTAITIRGRAETVRAAIRTALPVPMLLKKEAPTNAFTEKS